MVVDIIIIAILALSIFLGYKKGLIELGIKAVAVIIAIVGTLILYRPITNIIVNTTNLDEKIQQVIMEKSGSVVGNGTTGNAVGDEIVSEIQNQMLPNTAHELALNIIRAGVMFIIYIVIKIALKFVTALANLIAKLPILDQFNKLGGIVYVAIRGLLIIYVALSCPAWTNYHFPFTRSGKYVTVDIFLLHKLHHTNHRPKHRKHDTKCPVQGLRRRLVCKDCRYPRKEQGAEHAHQQDFHIRHAA